MAKSFLYREVHGTTGPYLLLVHGIMSSRAQWIPNLEALGTFCRPVVVELLGHGRSPSPDDPGCYTPESYMGQFETIRRELSVDRWLVCGQSLGASLTLRYALEHPERVIAQVFTNSRSALWENPTQAAMEMAVKSLRLRGPQALNDFPLHPSRSRHLEPAVKKALVQDVERIDLLGFSNTLLHMVPRCSVRDRIRENTVPTLLVVGRFDKQFAHLVDYAEKTMPFLEITVLEGGHAINADAAQMFNEAVEAFFSRFLKEG